MHPETTLSPTELADLRCAAGLMIPASAELGMPGADDSAVIADIAATIGRDLADVRASIGAVAGLAAMAPAARDAAVAAWREAGGAPFATLSRVILQCYYRDDRVVRALGREARAPFPLGNVLEQGDWSLLDPVRARAPIWRKV
jgi:hypothetical protein